MMSSEQIAAMSRAAARRSAREGVAPFIVEAEDLVSFETFSKYVRIPFIGSRTPKGWKLLNASKLLGSERNCVPSWHDSKKRCHYMQCDCSGFGTEDEPAFTRQQFYDAAKMIGPGKGYAIVEAGQFQVVVGVFERRA